MHIDQKYIFKFEISITIVCFWYFEKYLSGIMPTQTNLFNTKGSCNAIKWLDLKTTNRHYLIDTSSHHRIDESTYFASVWIQKSDWKIVLIFLQLWQPKHFSNFQKNIWQEMVPKSTNPGEARVYRHYRKSQEFELDWAKQSSF